MSETAFYGRKSSDVQKETSIEDQQRRCRHIAEQNGLSIREEYEFSDDSITGRASGRLKRVGYQRLLDAIEARLVGTVVVDEVSRLTRHVTEGGKLMDLVDRTGVRFITADGIDTAKDGWRQIWMLKLMMSSVEVEATGHRTIRGMLGQLERGYQIAQAPFGYRPFKKMTETGRILGTTWEVYEPEAAVIREMYKWRYEGMSVAGIARRLQEMGITPAGQHRVDCATYWRPGSVYRLLGSTIYRGVFQWNGSGFTKTKCKKQRKTPNIVDFDREVLRIVSDEVWYTVNRNRNSRSVSERGGGKHLFAGLVSCGDCGARCCVGSSGMSLYCPQCLSAYKVAAKSDWMGYSSVAAGKQALRWAMGKIFSESVKNEFHRRLDERLKRGPRQELEAVQKRGRDVQQRIERIKMLILNPATDPSLFSDELNSAVSEQKIIEARINSLKRTSSHLTEDIIRLQRDINPVELFDELIEGNGEVYKMRATLRRLLSRFVFVARPSKGHSVFHISVRAGAYVAELSDTPVVDEGSLDFEVHVRVSAARPSVWQVSGYFENQTSVQN